MAPNDLANSPLVLQPEEAKPLQLGARRRRPVPDPISRYYIPGAVVDATQRHMRRFGRERRECYVWWAGYFTAEGNGQVLTAICPEVTTDFGRVYLTHEQLVTLHNYLRSLDQVLLIELHSHPPGAGGQNEVDAAHPASTHRGFVSIVVPNFGFVKLPNLQDSHIYEYLDSLRWRELGRGEIKARFVVEQTVCRVDL